MESINSLINVFEETYTIFKLDIDMRTALPIAYMICVLPRPTPP